MAPFSGDLLAFAWPLRTSPFVEVRRSVLLAVACALLHMGAERVVADGRFGPSLIEELSRWTLATESQDSDGECRRLAALLHQTSEASALSALLLTSVNST